MNAKRRTNDEWKELFAQQEKYEGTVKNFCESIGVSTKSYYGAKHRINEDKDEIHLVPVVTENKIIRIKVDGITLELDNNISSDMIAKIIQACHRL